MQAIFSFSFANRETAGARLEKYPTPAVAAAEVWRNWRRESERDFMGDLSAGIEGGSGRRLKVQASSCKVQIRLKA
jgi:hypothetical protein